MAWTLDGTPPSIASPGVYEILNVITGDLYIGSTKNLKDRFYSHRNSLRREGHANKHLQSSYNKYGVRNFVFNIILVCGLENLFLWEDKIVDTLKPSFNKRPVAHTNLGLKMSEETKLKISLAHKGKNNTTEYQRMIISKTHKGKIMSEEVREKIRVKLLGRKMSPKSCEKKRLSRLGKVQYCKTYAGLVSPDGTIYKDITNMSKFGREHGFNKKHIWAVLVGKVSQHKGWRLYKEEVCGN